MGCALLAVSACDRIMGSDRVVEQGECCGLRIGQSKAEVIEALRIKRVGVLTPDVVTPLFTKKASGLNELREAPGFCAGDNRGLALTVGFGADGRVETLDHGVESKGGSLGVVVGQTRAEVMDLLRGAFERHPGLVVSSCVPRSRGISIEAPNETDLAYLMSFDAWGYGEPGTYSFAKVIFRNGTLARIEYHHRPFEPS